MTTGLVGLAGFAAIAYVVLELAPNWFAETEGLDADGRADARQGVRTASLALVAGAIGVVGAVYTARTFALNRAGQLTDRFSKAIEQLGHQEQLDVRLGGIYALERIARDSRDDHFQVVEVLTAYVREHAPRPDKPRPPALFRRRGPSGPEAHELREEGAAIRVGPRPGADVPPVTDARPTPATDVQAVLTVLGRRTLAHEQDIRPALDLPATHLRRANLAGANLAGANLHGANLHGANLSGASLTEAHLNEAELSMADLRRADLTGANLHGADLSLARLSEAKLTEANLTMAELKQAHLHMADLRRANLTEADLTSARLHKAGIRGATLTGAFYDDRTTWPQGFDPEAAGAREVDDGDQGRHEPT